MCTGTAGKWIRRTVDGRHQKKVAAVQPPFRALLTSFKVLQFIIPHISIQVTQSLKRFLSSVSAPNEKPLAAIQQTQSPNMRKSLNLTHQLRLKEDFGVLGNMRVAFSRV